MTNVALKVAIAAAMALVVAARPSWRELEGYTFEQFVADFQIKLEKGSTEYNTRKLVFLNELARVRAHNAKNLSWKEGVNKFSAMTPLEKKAFFGRSKSVAQNHKPRHLMPADVEGYSSVEHLPRAVDWRQSGIVNAVKDQGHCGSCWAFASTSVMESHVAKNTGLLFDLSVEQTAMCTPNPDQCGGTGGCNGATSELAFDYVAHSNGLLQEYQYPYTSYYGVESACNLPVPYPVATIDGYVQLPANNYTALMNSVATVGPIAISVDASSWHAYESGIYSGCNQKNPDIDHAVVLVGYGVDNGQQYWTVRNSWSPAWGEKGYIRLARLDNEEELCGMDITPSDGSACAGQTDPVRACGTCGILFDSAYPVGARLA